MSARCAQACLTGSVLMDKVAGGVQVRAPPERVVTKSANAYLGPLVPGRGRTPRGTSSQRARPCCQCAANGEGRQPGTSATDEVSSLAVKVSLVQSQLRGTGA